MADDLNANHSFSLCSPIETGNTCPPRIVFSLTVSRAAGTQSRSKTANGSLVEIEPALFSASLRLRESLGCYGCSSAKAVQRTRSPSYE